MAGKKGVIPSHVKKKEFMHPRIDHPVIQALECVEDPRKPSLFFRHSLTSTLFMVVVSMACGAEDFPQTVAISLGIVDWLAKYVDMSGGVPCERTFKHLLGSIREEAMEDVLRGLAASIRKEIPNEVLSFDGQTARGTADEHKDLDGIHLLNVWSSDNGICLGQIKVDDKSNEITAMPKLMDKLNLVNTIVTADALNTQKVIVEKTIAAKGNYVLPVKANHPELLEDVILMFEGTEDDLAMARKQWEWALAMAKEHRDEERLKQLLTDGIPMRGAFFWQDGPEKAHGRIETRTCMTIPVGSLAKKNEWQGLATLARIDRERIVKGKVTTERMYYISSLPPTNPGEIARAAREHWGVENQLHWCLDVIFRQDLSHYRDRIGARNLAAIRKIVLNALKEETSFKGSLATKQRLACCNHDYRDKILKILF
jgi:predicted transposase YbfD/YdcC